MNKQFQANIFVFECFIFHFFLQILIDGRDPNATDEDGNVLPTLVYLAREKRPQHHHNFKAGAMNALVMCILADKMAPFFFSSLKAYAVNSQLAKHIVCFNVQIRVSSKISNGPIILNVDCDMYSNNSHSVRDALCFFMDEEKGHEIAFVQFPQNFENITKNEIYSSSMRVISEVRKKIYYIFRQYVFIDW